MLGTGVGAGCTRQEKSTPEFFMERRDSGAKLGIGIGYLAVFREGQLVPLKVLENRFGE